MDFIKTGIVATIFSFFLGIFAARKIVKASPGVKAVLDGILTLPMVLPPTVAGFSCCLYLADVVRLESSYMKRLILRLFRAGLAA